ncbi:hypothetical protein Tco_0730072 [Tanacetum coccineum]|uniref:Uncharacterized protein n=1 Tax=Tanacetum coccineum TaxID=301880 RepID=A0ABQ4YT61_9ASTR
MTKAITDFGVGTITIYPDIDPFLEDTEEEEKSMDDWDQFLDFNLDDIPLLGGEEIPPFEEAAKEALTLRISKKFALLEEVRPVLETMAYHDKYKKVNENALADTRQIAGNAHECSLSGGGTTLIPKFLILDIPIDRNAPIVVGRGFLHTIGGIVNTPERLFSTFDGFCHQTFRAARSDVIRNGESDSDDEEEYKIKRNKFGAPIYGPKPAPFMNCNDPAQRSLWEETMLKPDHRDPNALDNLKIWKRYCFHKFIMISCYRKVAAMRRSLGIDDMLRIKLREAKSNEEIFTSVAWIRAFNIKEPIYVELCHEFYSTYEFDEVCGDDELQIKKIIKFRLGERAHNLTLLECAHRLGLYIFDLFLMMF